MTRLDLIRAKIARLEEIRDRLETEEYNRHPHKQDAFSKAICTGHSIMHDPVFSLDQLIKGETIDIEIIRGEKS